jgi:hypothetical protein
MATARKPSKRPSPEPKRKTAKAITAPRAPSTTTVSAKAFAAALTRIGALERRIAQLSALPIRVAPGGDVTIEAGAALILRGATIKLEAAATLQMQGARIDVTAGLVNVDTGIVKASGIVKCDTLQTNSVIASSYTPGAGNVW